MDADRELFVQRARGLFDRTVVVEMRSTMLHTDKQLTQVRRDSAKHGLDIQAVKKRINSVAENGLALQRGVDHISMGVDQMPQDIQRILENDRAMFRQGFREDVREVMLEILGMTGYSYLTRLERRRSSSSSEILGLLANTQIRRSSATFAMAQSEFVERIGSPAIIANKDINRVARMQSFDRQSIGQANSLVGKPKFGYWVTDKCSSFLLVEARLSKPTKLSAMSLFCAHLAQNVSKAGAGVLLAHFCGGHLSGNEALDGPIGLMRSLVAQLTVYLNFTHQLETDILYDRVDCEKAVRGDLGALFQLFRQLLEQVPADVPVFCIIDNIACFESEGDAELEMIVGHLFDLFQDDSVNTMFKVLLTSPGRMVSEMPIVPEENRVRLTSEQSGQRSDLQRSMKEVSAAASDAFSEKISWADRMDSGIGDM